MRATHFCVSAVKLLDNFLPKKESHSSRSFAVSGTGVGDLSATGTVRFWKKKAARPDSSLYRGEEREREEIKKAISKAKEELASLSERTLALAGRDAAAIFEVHGMLLSDPDFLDAIDKAVSRGLSAVDAVSSASDSVACIFESMDDEYLSARGADIRDVGGRVVSILTGSESTSMPLDSRGTILVAEDLSPGDTAKLDPSRVVGIVTFGGSARSHTAILARALSIPCIVCTERFGEEYDGASALIDASVGKLYIEPTAEKILSHAERLRERQAESHRLRTLLSLPAVTKSGRKVSLYANIGSVADAHSAHAAGAEGIGLFRSEFLFLGRPGLPSEEEQFSAYKKVAEIMHDVPGPVVIRTLDIGADKTLSSLSMKKEANPALGVRGLRLCLRELELFRTQLRAILRASAYGRIALMLPMVVNADEVRTARHILAEAKNALRYEEIPFDENICVGIMIETPASALMADRLAPECDFFSVGTNDLCQYTFAADREEPSLSYLSEGEDALEPVLRMIRLASEGIHRAGGDRFLGICGELAADVSLCEKFLSLGADELSVSPPYIPKLKDAIRALD